MSGGGIQAWLAATAAAAFTAVSPAGASFVNFEGRQTAPVRLSPGGQRLFAVNTPDARVSVFDVSNPSHPVLIAEIPVGLEPVSVQPVSDDEAWVVNELSDCISVVSVSRGIVTDTLEAGDEPADVVFAQGRAFVTASRDNEIRVYDAATRLHLTNIAVQGENPRALAASPDGSRVYALFSLSGNRTTLVPATNAPPQPPPNVITNTPPQVGLIVDATDPAWTNIIRWTIPDYDIAVIDASSLTVTAYVARVGTVNFGLCVLTNDGSLYVVNTDARNLERFEPTVRSRAVDNRVTRVATNGTVAAVDLNPGIDYNILPNPSAMSNALAQPAFICHDPTGNCFYVAAFGTDRIARIDTNGIVLARIEVGGTPGTNVAPRSKRGPRGLAIRPDARILYSLNRIANSITVISLTNDAVVREIPAGSVDPTPPVVREGRGFLYDAKLSGNGTMSCASCHVDSDMDLLAWDLGDPDGQMQVVTQVVLGATNRFTFHPMKGPMTTQTLRGLKDLDPLHWRGDRADFTKFNVAFPGLMGGSALSSNDMAAFRDFVNTLAFPPNPNLNLDRSLPASLDGGDPVAGSNLYVNVDYVPTLRCNTCHAATPGPGSNRLIITASALQESQDFKVPHLRNIYQKLNVSKTNGATTVNGFGIVHDGEDHSLFDFLSRPVFGVFAGNATTKRNVEAFVKCFDTGTAPAVGHGFTAQSNNVASASVTGVWATLEQQAAASNIDLVVRGTINGVVRSMVYAPASGLYVTDAADVGPFARSALVARVLSGDVLTTLGVPPGSGQRMGRDRDENGVADGDEPPVVLDVAAAGPRIVTSWPTGAYWHVLEQAGDLMSPAWNTVTSERNASGPNVVVTNEGNSASSVFRLRRPW